MKIVFATGNKGKLREAAEILGECFELLSPAEVGITDDVEETGDTLKENSIIKAEYIYSRLGGAQNVGQELICGDAVEGKKAVEDFAGVGEVAVESFAGAGKKAVEDSGGAGEAVESLAVGDRSDAKAERLVGNGESAGVVDCFADDTGLEVDALGGAPGVHSARYATDGHDFEANIDKLLAELEKHPGEPRTARFRSVVTLIYKGERHFFEGTLEGRIAPARRGGNGFGYDPVFIPDCYPDRTVAELDDETKNAISHRGKALRAMAEWLRNHAVPAGAKGDEADPGKTRIQDK